MLQVLRLFCASAIHYTPRLSFSAAQATIVVAQAAVTMATANVASANAVHQASSQLASDDVQLVQVVRALCIHIQCLYYYFSSLSYHHLRRSRRATSPESRLPKPRSRLQSSKYSRYSRILCHPLLCTYYATPLIYSCHIYHSPGTACTHLVQLAGANAVRQSSHQRQRGHVSFDWIVNQVCRFDFFSLPICR